MIIMIIIIIIIIIIKIKRDIQNSLRFWDTNRSSNIGQKTRPTDKKKEKLSNNEICHSAGLQNENQRKRTEIQVLRVCQRIKKKLWNMKVMMIPILIGARRTISKGLMRSSARVGNRRTSWDHPNYGIVKIGQNTKKSPGDSSKLVVT